MDRSAEGGTSTRGLLHGHEKEWGPDVRYDVDEEAGHKRPHICDSCLRNVQNQKTSRDRAWVSGGWAGVGGIREVRANGRESPLVGIRTSETESHMFMSTAHP